MTHIKICGIQRTQEALAALACGADMLGFIFYKPAPRYVAPERVADIVRRCRAERARWRAIGVFVNEAGDEVKAIAERCGLDAVQLAGDETPDYCRQLAAPAMKSVRGTVPVDDYGVERFVVDTLVPGFYGGTGVAANWHALGGRLDRHILAGGLRPDNVREALTITGAWGVDVSSGVERDGHKDAGLIQEFIAAVREHDAAAAH